MQCVRCQDIILPIREDVLFGGKKIYYLCYTSKYYINATLNSFGVKNFLEMTQTLLPIINLLCRIIEKTEESWPNLQMD